MNSYVIMTKDFSDIWINYLSNIQKININRLIKELMRPLLEAIQCRKNAKPDNT